jgi:hypothetical protein
MLSLYIARLVYEASACVLGLFYVSGLCHSTSQDSAAPRLDALLSAAR